MLIFVLRRSDIGTHQDKVANDEAFIAADHTEASESLCPLAEAGESNLFIAGGIRGVATNNYHIASED